MVLKKRPYNYPVKGGGYAQEKRQKRKEILETASNITYCNMEYSRGGEKSVVLAYVAMPWLTERKGTRETA